MRKTLKVVAFGGGPADAFIKAAGITDSTQQTAIKTVVNDLNGYGLWSKMKAIYPMVGGNATAHSYNLKDITKFQIAFSGGWTHASTGATPNGTNAFGNTAFIPSSNGLAYNNNHLSFYSRTSQTGATQFYEMGSGNNAGSNNLSLFIRRNTDLAGYDSGDFLTNRLTFTNTNGQGFYCGTAPTTTSKYFKNGISQASKSLSVKSISNLNTYIGAFNEDNTVVYYSNKECAFATIGEGLSDTEAANLYTSIQKFQTTLNRFVGTPIYPSFDSDAQSFMTSASITDSTQQAAINYLVTDLKSNNLWTKMKAVYPMVGGNATSHSYNLKNPSQFQITWNGGLTHSSTGVLPNGTTGYGNTNFNPSSNITTNSAHHSFYFRTSLSIGRSASIGIANMSLAPYSFNIGWVNDMFDGSASRIAGNVGNSTGYVIGTRSSSSSHKLFRNNTQIANTTAATTGTPPNANYFIGASNVIGTPTYYDSNEMAMVTLGDGLTDTEASNLYTIIQNYQTILSRNI